MLCGGPWGIESLTLPSPLPEETSLGFDGTEEESTTKG